MLSLARCRIRSFQPALTSKPSLVAIQRPASTLSAIRRGAAKSSSFGSRDRRGPPRSSSSPPSRSRDAFSARQSSRDERPPRAGVGGRDSGRRERPSLRSNDRPAFKPSRSEKPDAFDIVSSRRRASQGDPLDSGSDAFSSSHIGGRTSRGSPYPDRTFAKPGRREREERREARKSREGEEKTPKRYGGDREERRPPAREERPPFEARGERFDRVMREPRREERPRESRGPYMDRERRPSGDDDGNEKPRYATDRYKDRDRAGPSGRFDRKSREEGARPARLYERESRSKGEQPNRSYNRESRVEGQRSSEDAYGIRPPRIKEKESWMPVPHALPFTTAASEFLYGKSEVLAALKAQRRKLYKLYLHPRAQKDAKDKPDFTLKKWASLADVKVVDTHDGWLELFDDKSKGKPHNGVILEASPLPKPKVRGLEEVSEDHFTVDLMKQNKEEEEINGTNKRIPFNSNGWRRPLVLLIDCVKDVGNLGAIIRSAYFLGVDAIALSAFSTASFTPGALKVSSGAAEALPLFTTDSPAAFLKKSRAAGWVVYGADMPEVDSLSSPSPIQFTPARKESAAVAPLGTKPSILILSSEEEGMRAPLRNWLDYTASIRMVREKDLVGVDSLNVSVASALLTAEFMKKPASVEAANREERAADTEAGEAAEAAAAHAEAKTDPENKVF